MEDFRFPVLNPVAEQMDTTSPDEDLPEKTHYTEALNMDSAPISNQPKLPSFPIARKGSAYLKRFQRVVQAIRFLSRDKPHTKALFLSGSDIKSQFSDIETRPRRLSAGYAIEEDGNLLGNPYSDDSGFECDYTFKEDHKLVKSEPRDIVENFSGKIDWNEEFQILLENPVTTPEQLDEQKAQIRELSRKFLEESLPIVKVIVEERSLPESKKTIKPAAVGGIAGGSKFIKNNTFFKFAKDTRDAMYGGDEFAMKSAGHELKSLNELISCHIPKLHFPLMCLINYLGWRVMCISVLPINNETLVYGSEDGGRTIMNSSPSMHQIMVMIGQKLFLKEHLVRGNSIIGPGDVEGHQGYDGRFYIADVSRLFPPAFLHNRAQKTIGSIWFRLLRPEFLRYYRKPLSSDAFSVMGTDDKEVHNEEILEATTHLELVYIPQFASDFEEWFEKTSTHSAEQVMLGDQIKQHLHKYGINLRYLFVVLCHFTTPELKRMFVIEICARTMRKLLWQKLRESPVQTHQKEALALLNMLFSDTEISRDYMKGAFVSEVMRRFIISTKPADHPRQEEYLRTLLIITPGERLLLFQRLLDIGGIEVYFQRHSKVDKSNWFQQSEHTDGTLSSDDLEQIRFVPTSAAINVATYTRTYEHIEDEIAYNKLELKAAIDLVGKIHIRVAQYRDHLAMLYRSQGKKYFKKAEKNYLLALEIREKLFGANNINVATYLDIFSGFYLQFGEHQHTQQLLQRSLAIKQQNLDPDHLSIATTLANLAEVYRKEGDFQEAEEKFQMSLTIIEKSFTEDVVVATVLKKMALLYRQQGKYDKAEPLYLRALKIMEARCGEEHSSYARVLANLAQLYQLQGKLDKAEPLFVKCLRIESKALGQDHIDVASTLNQLAQLYACQNKYDEATAMYQKALTTRKNVPFTRTLTYLNTVMFVLHISI
eukprot:TRINITY_DN4498_c0_g1_i2.p1 TRINITY_DN4498_c0_g1~~TRINITY_DN4498_c0_g1_i2.p1  ORF type:complete len:936 (+),score=227.54 TRINITY_DN4498_c0_g1_i2:85-2892(+)